MFSWKEFEKTKSILSQMGGIRYKDEWGQHHLFVRPVELLDWMQLLKEDLDFFTLSDIAAIEEGNGFEIVYHLLNMGTHQRLNLHVQLSSNEVLPSVVPFFMNADWMEREQAEMLNVSFERKKEALFLPSGQQVFPLRKKAMVSGWPLEQQLSLPGRRYNPNKSEAPYPEESWQWKRFDLFSPETTGLFELLLCFDPERVMDSRLRVGFHHQGLEKLFEQKDAIQILQLIDKLNLSAAPQYSIAWTRAIEEMFRIRIPERAQAIRIIMLELARVADHLTVLAAICREIHQSEFKLFINAREKVYELFEKFSGSRHGLGVSRFGGVQEDLPPGWIVEYQRAADVLLKNLKIIHRSLIGQVNFRSNLEGEDLAAQSVVQWGITGPAMRAAGLNFDLRKSQPFYFYQDIDFDIPVGIHGSTYDRYLIRFEEIYQSIRIITQVIDNLPLGEIVSEAFSGTYFEQKLFFNGLDQPVNWHYSAIEAASGESGFLLKFEGTLAPARLKIKTPGTALAQALPIFLRGLTASQISSALASLGLSRWELDR